MKRPREGPFLFGVLQRAIAMNETIPLSEHHVIYKYHKLTRLQQRGISGIIYIFKYYFYTYT